MGFLDNVLIFFNVTKNNCLARAGFGKTSSVALINSEHRNLHLKNKQSSLQSGNVNC
jgi:hypothetical protein